MSRSRALMRKPPTQLPARYRDGFPWTLDKRYRLSRELAADMIRLWADLGGVDSLSAQQLIVVERLAFLRQRLLEHEQAVLAGKEPPMKPNEYAASLNSLLGLCKAVGMTRRARDVGTLTEWLKASEASPEAAGDVTDAEIVEEAGSDR